MLYWLNVFAHTLAKPQMILIMSLNCKQMGFHILYVYPVQKTSAYTEQ